VPEVAALQGLDRVLAAWPKDRKLLWCDEHRASGGGTLEGERGLPWAVLIGPEGGFSEAERKRLAAMPHVVPFALGPRILRADTAAVAALTLWQAALGDWA
jgi:16S rRNA (uracil1498-N3)-methyltransferase